MRQVPEKLTDDKTTNRPLHYQLLSMMFSAEMANNMMLVLFAFLFLGPYSPLGQGLKQHQQVLAYGLAMAFSKLGGLVANTGLSSLSDSFGRSHFMRWACIGLLVLALGGAISIQYHHLYLFYAALIIYSMLYSLRPIALAEIGNHDQRHKKVLNMAYLQASIALGASLGPLLSTHLGGVVHGLAPLFLLAGCFALLALACSLFRKPPAHQQQPHAFATTLKHWKAIVAAPRMRGLFLLLMLNQLAWSSYYDFIPLTLKLRFQQSIALVGDFVAGIALCLIIACLVIMPLLQRFLNTQQIMKLSAWSLCGGLVLTALTSCWLQHGLLLMSMAIFFTASGDVLFYSTLISKLSDYADNNQQGSVMGLNYLVIVICWSSTGFLGGWLSQWGNNLVLLCAPIFAIVLLFLLRTNLCAIESS